ncbi:DMT family transporter [Aestuariirhabdus sp. Z084]|uniref:DMT family transporter n=1 Tax=Aestuariirhabdus haliotis TaxID=2918751 RepID=UPI0020C0B81C|nr:DMT family transporter [Aestuariirhabdus haliotis]MCL6415413.1 DMT family transporter [Aestuariirhabdus haliotis]
MKVLLAYIGVVLIWSTTPLGIKWSVESVYFVDAVFARMGVAAILSWLLLEILGGRMVWRGQALRSYFAASLGIWGCMLLVYWSAQTLPSGVMSVLFGLSPLITGVIATLVLREQAFTRIRLLSLLLALSGLMVVFSGDMVLDGGQLPALLVNLTAVALFCVSAVWVKRLDAAVDPQQQATGSLILSIPVFVVFWALMSPAEVEIPGARSVLAILYLAFFGSVIGFVLYFYILRNLTASQVSLIPMMTPCFALMLGHLLNDEALTLTTVVGALMIVSALALYFGEAMLPRLGVRLTKFRQWTVERR